MMPCPTEQDFVRFIDGALSVEATEHLKKHVARCPRCREHEELLRALIADIRAPVLATLDIEAHRRAVWERLDRPVARDGNPHRRWLLAGAASAAACVMAAYLGVRATSERDAWQARGGAGEHTIARDVSVRPCTIDGQLQPLRSGATIDRSAPLTATFRNLGTAPAYLLLFAVDVRHEVHWITPRYVRAEEDPVATALPVTARETPLDTTVLLEDLSTGPLHILAVISSMPAHVSDVESMEGSEIDAAHLARRAPPGTEIREMVVEVAAETGGRR
jgi:hypothetical protein